MLKRRFKVSLLDTTKILLSLIFIAFVFFPILNMFLIMDAQSIQSVVSSPVFGVAIKNSLVSTFISTVITVLWAYVAAIIIERVNIKGKRMFHILFVLPMLVPSISNGMGLTILLGNNGFLTRIINLDTGIYGPVGIVMGSILYAFPIAFLMLSDVIRYEDASPYEAAKVLKIPEWRQFASIGWPYLRKPLLNVIFATFSLIITDYGVPLMIGGKYTTIPTVMYQEVIGQLNFGKGVVYGAILLVPALLAFFMDLFNRDKGNLSYVTRKHAKSNSAVSRVAGYIVCALISTYMLLPTLAFLLLSFAKDYPNDMTFTLQNLQKTLNLRVSEYLFNSLLIAISVAVIGVAVAFVTAYLSARVKSKASKFLHLSAITSAAIPGVVLGLAYVISFKQSFIYGTIIVLIVVNLVHFISSPYLMMYNSLSKINSNLEAVANTMGIGRLHMVKDVFVPMCKYSLYEMFSYFFVNCMITISAVSFLANTNNKPIALMINQFEAQMQLESAAIVSLMILGSNLVIKGVFQTLKSMKMNKKNG